MNTSVFQFDSIPEPERRRSGQYRHRFFSIMERFYPGALVITSSVHRAADAPEQGRAVGYTPANTDVQDMDGVAMLWDVSKRMINVIDRRLSAGHPVIYAVCNAGVVVRVYDVHGVGPRISRGGAVGRRLDISPNPRPAMVSSLVGLPAVHKPGAVRLAYYRIHQRTSGASRIHGLLPQA